jgi:hypothetical protein
MSGMKQITSFSEHYVRNPTVWTPENHEEDAVVVFCVGIDIYTIRISQDGTTQSPQVSELVIILKHSFVNVCFLPFWYLQKVNIDFVTPRQQRHHFFTTAANQVTNRAISRDGTNVAFISRGRWGHVALFCTNVVTNKECEWGRLFVQQSQTDTSVVQYGQPHGVRYTHAEFLPSGDLVAVSDETDEAALEVFQLKVYQTISLFFCNLFQLSFIPAKLFFDNCREEDPWCPSALLVVDMELQLEGSRR